MQEKGKSQEEKERAAAKKEQWLKSGKPVRRRGEAKDERKLRAQQMEEARLQAKATSHGTMNITPKKIKKGAGDPNDFIDPVTPYGHKKILSPKMAMRYKPSVVEKAWYSWWESSGYFKADSASSKPPFVMVLPPPNVTGDLHISHTLTVVIEDAIIRWRRMSGYNALWVSGLDHGSLTTQLAVGVDLMRERKLTRHDIGREDFVSEVRKRKDENDAKISNPLRCLGASLDWSCEAFTMDEQSSEAVTEAFVRLHKEGLIYRDCRPVNWDCTLQTTISDMEVRQIDLKEETMLKVPSYADPVEFGVLIHFAYRLENGVDEIVVATSRVETMLGDTAIAVHPKDKRYVCLHGMYAVHPFVGRRLKIICDEAVDPSFGTGAVKITPAHDPNDFEIGKRHNLEFMNILTSSGRINNNGGEFEGMPRFTARVAIIKALKEKGLYKNKRTQEMRLSISLRTNDVVEPMIKTQWFFNCKTSAKVGLGNSMSKKIQVIPQQYEQDLYRCLENTHDWCVSGQLCWGHHVPAWYVTLEDDQDKTMGSNRDAWIVARNESDANLEAQKKYPGKRFCLDQDPDVLDTWFSSGLFPLTVLGWPANTAGLHDFYPTSVLETGINSLMWVARMVMMGLQLGVPFQKVYLHGTICDKDGKEMLESHGNVIHPLQVISDISLKDLKNLAGDLDPNELNIAKEGKKKDYPGGITEFGADALRFALISYTSEIGSINMDIGRVVKYQQWCSRLWSGFRMAMDKLGDDYIPPATVDISVMPPICKWVLYTLNKAIDKTVTSLEAFKLSDAASAIYSWWQHALRDKFLEAIKSYFSEDSERHKLERAASRYTLWVCLDTSLRLLHPFMPYITEELWQRLPHREGSRREASIMISQYPSVTECWNNDNIENEMAIVFKVAEKIKSLIPPKDQNERRCAFALCRGREIAATIAWHRHIISSLSSVSRFKVLRVNCEALDDCVSTVVNADLSVHLKLKGAFNMVTALEKLRKKRDEILKLQDTLTQKMGACGYRENVRKNIQEEDKRRLTSLSKKLDAVSGYEMKLDAIGVGESHDSLLSSKISALCKEESWPDMSQPGHAAPLTLDQGALIEERFLAFLREFRVNGHMFYRNICRASLSMQNEEICINYKHLQLFDPSLANTVSIFCGSVQKYLVNAAKVFLKEEVRCQFENIAVRICDLPPRSFLPLKEFWDSPGNHPSEEADIFCGEISLGITKSTPAGRIVLYNLLRKLFGSFERGNSYNGNWGIGDVMVDPDTYQVEIIKPFCGDCNHKTMLNDLRRCAIDIIPEFKCDGRLPAFFGPLQGSLNHFIPDRQLNAATWKKFCDFILAHLALKPPLVRSAFFDNLHEMLWTLGRGAKKILELILNYKFNGAEWNDFLMSGEFANPILAVVYMHNKKKKEKIAQEKKAAGASEGADQDDDKVDQDDDKVDPDVVFAAKYLEETGTLAFEKTAEGLLIFSRHIKQHGSAGAKDNKGEQTLEILSDVDLVMSHYLEMLIHVLHALIYNIDCVDVDCSSPDYKKFMVMFEEIFKEYNAPEAVPLPNRHDECEKLAFLEHHENLCLEQDLDLHCAVTGQSGLQNLNGSAEGEGAKVESPSSSVSSTV